MSSKREILQILVRGIRQDIEGYKQLKSLLNRQRELMQRRDNDGLKHHNQHQTRLCDELMVKAKKRSDALNQLGFSEDANGMKKLIDKLPKQSSLQVNLLWENLLALVKESQQANEANGKLLVSQQTVINNLLSRDTEKNVDYGASKGL
ncbi:FlgN protein [Shewanella psychrophila]|uniref:FlgN protein n=1 Tax=Shewanella psychrophila TaxID=225848 RepID=A0A1S6HII8_9GAMM|nr:flagellar protein FlgN [Shewanella psychrophila]AQS35332.1 FlgN protein [Shewanella psychrophila]